LQLLKEETHRKLIDQLIWHLSEECAPHNSEEIKHEAAECLGELGAIDPYGIAFFFPSGTVLFRMYVALVAFMLPACCLVSRCYLTQCIADEGKDAKDKGSKDILLPAKVCVAG
jgi:hypothetical protein